MQSESVAEGRREGARYGIWWGPLETKEIRKMVSNGKISISKLSKRERYTKGKSDAWRIVLRE